MTTLTAPRLDDLFARELPELGVSWQPNAPTEPALVLLNEAYAEELGLDVEFLRSPAGLAFLSGAAVPDDANPIAMAYAGHQFGNYSPRLGDGRAVLLGELAGAAGGRTDIHLKGSGRTPFARGGDGKATLGPMLREYIMCEAMHALGVPTTRALAVVSTGEQVMRTGWEPGALFVRAASSHLRVGTFEYAARLQDPSVLVRLIDHAIARHHPAAADAERPALALLDAVIEAQATLVARWMSLGFIHGVMNTDNTTISGETIDYGPCAFMEASDATTVFSSIDHGGRYAYGNQPRIMSWNLARLAETLLAAIDPDTDTAIELATAALEGFGSQFDAAFAELLAAKTATTDELSGEFVSLLHEHRLDHTQAYAQLADLADAVARADSSGESDPIELVAGPPALAAWSRRWAAQWTTPSEAAAAADELRAHNPLYVPRNQLVDDALVAAVDGDLAPVRSLIDVVTAPFERRADHDRWASPADDDFAASFRTFCGT